MSENTDLFNTQVLARALAPLGKSTLELRFQPEPVTIGMYFDPEGPPSAPPQLEPWERQIVMANPMTPLGGLPSASVAKQVVGHALAPLGKLEINKVVECDPIALDLWFEPSGRLKKVPSYLHLLHQMAPKPVLFELPATPLDEDTVSERLHKSLNWAEELRQRAPEKRRPPKPKMWILCKGAPPAKFEEFGLTPDATWPGFYHGAPALNYTVVLIAQLQEAAETLVLRLLGSEATRSKALAEIHRLVDTDAESEPLRELARMTAS